MESPLRKLTSYINTAMERGTSGLTPSPARIILTLTKGLSSDGEWYSKMVQCNQGFWFYQT